MENPDLTNLNLENPNLEKIVSIKPANIENKSFFLASLRSAVGSTLFIGVIYMEVVPSPSENIKKWLMFDAQLKLYNEKIKITRNHKNELTGTIINYMSSQKQPKIKTTEGELVLFEKKEYPPLTFTYIEKTLSKIISNKDQIEYIIQQLKENREIKTVNDLRFR
jgi:hypothetical protein